MFFQQRAMQLIGKSVDKLLNDYGKKEIPPEITSLVGQKFTFIIRVLSNKSIQKRDPSFEVLMIKQRFGRQANIPTLNKEEIISTTSTSTFELANLPPLVPITTKKIEAQSSFESQLTQDTQYMEIDKTGIWDDKDSTNKRNFEDFEDNEQDSNDDSDHDNTPFKPTKRTCSQAKSKQ